jgi:lipopolysaccharide transport system permease protein
MRSSAIGGVSVSVAGRSAALPAMKWTRYRDLVRVNAVRWLKVRYRGSILGVFWSLSNPLIMTTVYTLVFGTAFKSYYNNSLVDYVLAVFVGLAFLGYFSIATANALPSIVNNGSLMNKIALPPSIFPVSTVVAATFQLCVGVLPLLAVVSIVTSHDPLNAVALLVPAAALALMSMGFAFAASAVHVHFRDTSYIYELVVFVLWITSPIFYPEALVPATVRGYIAFNPLAVIIESARQIVLSGDRPSFHLMGFAMLSSLIVLVVGASIYHALRRSFMDLI